ncbi:MAG: hydroxyacylglutathione hydrolase family protein [Planctomycetota bacterium]
MIFEQIKAGGDRNFSYLIGDEGSRRCAVVDPSGNPKKMLARVNELGLEVVYLFNTHGHSDHTGGNDLILARSPAKLLNGNNTHDGHTLSLGKVTLRVIHTPGHTQDSLCVLATEPGDPGRLVTGDTLFVGKVGGTGYGADARNEYDSIHNKLMALPDEVEVWPGHDYGVAPSSTIGHERRTNPFILREDFESFVELKRNWLQYKAEHGIQ